MPRTKTIDTEDIKKTSAEEKIVEVAEVDTPLEIEDKTEIDPVPVTESEEDDLTDEEALLDTEEIDPFGDTWEQ